MKKAQQITFCKGHQTNYPYKPDRQAIKQSLSSIRTSRPNGASQMIDIENESRVAFANQTQIKIIIANLILFCKSQMRNAIIQLVWR